MGKRMLLLAAVAPLVLGLAACTRFESTYMKKVTEAEDLRSQVTALRQEHEELQRENGELKARIEDLSGGLAAMTAERDRLSADNRELEGVLQAKSDSLSRTIVELRGRIAVLETENGKLRQDLAALRQDFAEQRKAQEEKVKEVSSTYENLLEKMKKEVSEGQVTISELRGKLTVNMVDAILFEPGQAEVKKGGLEVLGKVASILKEEKDKAIRIEGHTDNVPITGALARKYPTNWELSAARAIHVARILQQEGIDPVLLSAVAYGEYRPIAGNDAPEGRAMNRRIEIILVPRE